MNHKKNTLLISIKNLNKDEYDPLFEFQQTLRSIGAVAEIITPYSNLPKRFNWKIKIWEFSTRLSEKRGFSFILVLIFLLKGLEIYRQLKLHWKDFDRILVSDRISGFAARKATNGQKPIILLDHYSSDPYMTYLYKYGADKNRFGYILMQKILISIFNQPIYKLLSTS